MKKDTALWRLKKFSDVPFTKFFMTHHPNTRFGLLRHTKTEWNQSRRIQGHVRQSADFDRRNTGPALGTASGRRNLEPRPIQRSWQGPENNRVDQSDAETSGYTGFRLREMDWGKWTGKTIAQLKVEFADIWAQQMLSEWDFCPPGGESFQSVWKRGREALVVASGKWPGEKILVVTHEGMIKSLIYHESTLSDFLKDTQCILPYHLHCLTFLNGRGLVQLSA